jgi:hypothetical protein
MRKIFIPNWVYKGVLTHEKGKPIKGYAPLYRYIGIILLAMLMVQESIGQDNVGDDLRKEGNLEGAILAYTTAFNQTPGNSTNTYNLACAYALTYSQSDSAFHYLAIALKADSTLWALADPDLISMIEDPRWDDIVTVQMDKYQRKNGMLKEPEYAKDLVALIKKDQALDYYIHLARSHFMKNGHAPHWYYPLSQMKLDLAKDNFVEMERLLKQYGWPKYSAVGDLAADAPLVIINHQEGEEARTHYLPQIKEACITGEGSCMEYAKIHDRILVNTDQLQTYGMQFKYNDDRQLEPFPIKDPEYVDQRRKEIGLEPLKDYLKRKIAYDWKVEQKTK